MTTVFPVVFGREDVLYKVSRGGALGALVLTAQVRMPHRSALACAQQQYSVLTQALPHALHP